MTQIRAVQGIRIAEYRRRLFERDAVLGWVDGRFPRVPFEHDSVYTKSYVGPWSQPDLSGGLFIGPAARCFRMRRQALRTSGVNQGHQHWARNPTRIEPNAPRASSEHYYAPDVPTNEL